MEEKKFESMSYDEMMDILYTIHDGCIKELETNLAKHKGKKVLVCVDLGIINSGAITTKTIHMEDTGTVVITSENDDEYTLYDISNIEGLVGLLRWTNDAIENKEFAHPTLTINELTKSINDLPLGGKIIFAETEDEGELKSWNEVKRVLDENNTPMFVFDHCDDGVCYISHDSPINIGVVEDALEMVTFNGTSYHDDDVVYLEY